MGTYKTASQAQKYVTMEAELGLMTYLTASSIQIRCTRRQLL
jgi:hypothetical protein